MQPNTSSKKRLNVQLLVIDPQKDFMDNPDSALPVPGANADMDRLRIMLDRVGPKLDDVHVTLDSHHVIDVAHPGMWRNQDGKMPPPFTIITANDIKAGVWRPRNEHAKPYQLGGKTLGQYMLGYAEALESGGKFPLMVWPEHCLIGTPGHNVQDNFAEGLRRWQRDNFATVDFVAKGTNPYTEHYGALMAEVPMASDPSTGLNTALLQILAQADMVPVAGQALSHCVRTTVTQIAENIGQEHIKKFVILTDCASPVPQPPGGPDFPALSQQWLKDMQALGMTLMTSAEFLA